MPSGLPARVVVVCILVFGVTIAHAERRPVAVIDLSGDSATAKLASDLNPVLLGHPELSPIPDASIPRELYGDFRDDDRDLISGAQTAKQTAEEQLAKFQFAVAEAAASNGQRDLGKAMPSSVVLALYAQLAFVRAQALLGMPARSGEAAASFALAHRLDSSFVPDAARYLPDVVQAFNNAPKKWSGKGTLVIAGTGKLWLDGKDSGNAPTELEVDAGPHVVWLTGPERETRTGDVLVETGKKAKVEIAEAPANTTTKVRRARAALRASWTDGAARAIAMKQIAALVRVRDAVLLTSVNGNIVHQTWNDGTREKPGFSRITELKKTDKPIEVLAPLEEAKPNVADVKPPEIKKPKVDDRRWYERRSIQASIIVGAIAAIIGGYYAYNALTDDTVRFGTDFGQASRERR